MGAFVNLTTFTSGTASTTGTLSVSNKAGNLLVICALNRGTIGVFPAVASVTDAGGNSYTQAATSGIDRPEAEIWYSSSIAVAGTVTVTWTLSCTPMIFCYEVSGQTASPLDGNSGLWANSSSPTTGSTVSTAQASEIAIAAICQNGAVTFTSPSSGYTLSAQLQSPVAGEILTGLAGYQILSTQGTQQFSVGSTAAAWAGAIATFKFTASSSGAGQNPKCVGLIDRQGIQAGQTFANWQGATLDSVGTPYNQALSGFVIRGANAGFLTWAELQPTAGAPNGTGAITGTPIDYAFAQADAYNATGPAIPWVLKMRLYCGINSPAWAQAIDGGPITGVDGTTLVWWAADVLTAWKNFMLTLGNYVPQYTVSATGLANTVALKNHTLLGEVGEALCGDVGSEPLLKDSWNVAAYAGSGGAWSWPVEKAQHEAAQQYMATAFPNTPYSFSYNPAVEVVGPVTDEAFTEFLMDFEVSSTQTFPLAVLANNSLRANGLIYPPAGGSNPGAYVDSHGGNYTPMYTHMAKYSVGQANTDLGWGGTPVPAPICIETSTYAKMGGTPASLQATLAYAVWIGARTVELPGYFGATDAGYQVLTVGQLLGYYTQVVQNDPLVSGSKGANGGTITSLLSKITATQSFAVAGSGRAAASVVMTGISSESFQVSYANPGLIGLRTIGQVTLDDYVNCWVQSVTIPTTRDVQLEQMTNRFGRVTRLKEDYKPLTVDVRGWWQDGGGLFFRDFKAALEMQTRSSFNLGDGTRFEFADVIDVTGARMASSPAVPVPNQLWAWTAKVASYEPFAREVSPSMQSLGPLTLVYLAGDYYLQGTFNVPYSGTAFGEPTFQINIGQSLSFMAAAPGAGTGVDVANLTTGEVCSFQISAASIVTTIGAGIILVDASGSLAPLASPAPLSGVPGTPFPAGMLGPTPIPPTPNNNGYGLFGGTLYPAGQLVSTSSRGFGVTFALFNDAGQKLYTDLPFGGRPPTLQPTASPTIPPTSQVNQVFISVSMSAYTPGGGATPNATASVLCPARFVR